MKARQFCGRLITIALLGGICSVAFGQTRLGVMGDSLTDEYSEQAYGSYADCWTELLILHRGVDMGPTASEAGQPGGTWGEPRRRGNRHNWARYGATTDAMLSSGQHTGLASDVATYGVSHAVLFIGVNDFSPWFGCFDDIYNGSWDQGDIDAWVASRVANITTALDAVTPTGVKLVIVNVPDPSIMPYVRNQYTDPVRRDAAAAAVVQVNAEIRALAEQYELALLDIFALTKAAFGENTAPHQYLYVGDIAIQLFVASGSNPAAGFVSDGVHPRTVLQGIFANAALTAMREAYGVETPLFSEEELLVNAGLTYGGEDTLAERIGEYTQYVTVFGRPGDLDHDGDVDADDFELFGGCMDGADVSVAGACKEGDFDGDADVDLRDFAALQMSAGA